MIKYILAVMLGVAGITVTQAQRMVPGQKGLEVTAGLLSKDAADNYYLNLTMTVNGKGGNYWIYGVEYTYRLTDYRDIRIPLETYMGAIGYSFQILSDAKKIVTLNAGITAIGGYETINRSEAILFDGSKILDKDNFIYGAGGRLSFETYLSDRLVLVLQGRTKALWGTDLKQFRPSAGMGFRFDF